MSNRNKAIIDGKIATNLNGMRVVNTYRSGDPLIGEIQYDYKPRRKKNETPPSTNGSTSSSGTPTSWRSSDKKRASKSTPNPT